MTKEIIGKKWAKIALILVAILVLFCVTGGGVFSPSKNNFEVNAATVVQSGTCGTCSWELDDEGLLRIYPTDGVAGTLSSNTSNSSVFWPWYRYRTSVKKVQIDEGVLGNSSCAYMFYLMSACTEIDLSGLDTSNVTSMYYMFYGCSGLTRLDVSNFNTSNVTNMSYMFDGCSGLTSLDLSNFNTSNVTTMYSMFSSCSGLTSLDVSNFDTSNVTDMGWMFYECSNLTSLDVSNFDTSKVTSMKSMFNRCIELTSLDVSNFDTSKVTNMGSMFEYCEGLISLDLSSFDTSKATDMGGMLTSVIVKTITFGDLFNASGKAIGLPYAKWVKEKNADGSETGDSTIYTTEQMLACTTDTTTSIGGVWVKATTQDSGICGTCSWELDDEGLLRIYPKDGVSGTLASISSLSGWPWYNYRTSVKKVQIDEGVSGNSRCDYMFYEMSSCTEMDLSGLDTSNVTNMSYMFYNCRGLTSLNVSNFNTNNVANMSRMFYNCSGLTSLDVSNFDTSNVTDMSFMFMYCEGLISLDLSSFDTSNVTDMTDMFAGCSGLTNLDVSSFDTSNVTSMYSMFSDCSGLTSLDLSNFNTSNVTDMSHMFDNCRGLTSLDLSNFNTSNVTDMKDMFADSRNLTSLDVSNFDTSNVTNMDSMFSGCSGLTKVKFGNTFTFVGTNHSFPAKSNWVKTRNADNSKTYDSTEYTSAQLTAFTAYTTPSIGGLWQSMETSSYTTNEDGSVEYISIDTDWDYLSDNVWTYTFNVFDISKLYYLFEEVIEGYFSTAMQPYAITVRDKQATVTNSTSVKPDVVERGSLTITKTVEGNPPKEEEFEFTLTLTGDYTSGTKTFSGVIFNNGVGTFILKNGEAKTFRLPARISYTVKEAQSARYNTVITPAQGTIVANETINVNVVNTYQISEPEENFVHITLRKTTSEGFSDVTKFAIDGYFEGLVPNKEYELSNGDKFTATASGTGFFEANLSADEEIIFLNIPVGATYQFTEQAGNYVSSYAITNGDANGVVVSPVNSNTKSDTALSTAVETADKDEKTTVEFKNEAVTMQGLTISKITLQETSSGDYQEYDDTTSKFEFTVNFSNMEQGSSFSSDIGKVVADDDGTASKTFYLMNGEEVKFYDIPVGVHYQVTESKNDIYKAGYEIDGINVVSDFKINDKANQSLSTEVETIDADENAIVNFANIKPKTQWIAVWKEIFGEDYSVEIDESEHLIDFEFTVDFSNMEPNTKFGYLTVDVDGNESDVTELIADNDGKLSKTFHLKDREGVVFLEVPVGTQYQVTEAESDYVAMYEINGTTVVSDYEENTLPNQSLSTEVETVDMNEDNNVWFGNIKPKTRSLAIVKIAQIKTEDGEGLESEDQFDFTINLSNLKPGTTISWATGSFTGSEAPPYNNSIADEDGNITISVKLKSYDGVMFESIPVGTKYQVTEGASKDYISGYFIEADSETANIVLQTKVNPVMNRPISTEIETVDIDEDCFVIVMNARDETQPLVTIRKVDSKGDYLAGVNLQILDRNGNVVVPEFAGVEADWITTNEETKLYLPEGTYILHEVSAPDRYILADDIEFTVTADGDNVVTMVNEKNYWMVSTGGQGLIKVIILAVALGAVAGACIYLGKKKSKDASKPNNKVDK